LKGAKLYRGLYTLGNVISSGGFATIHEATESGRDSAVVIKLCHRSEDPVMASLIVKEAELLQRLKHRNVVQIFPIHRPGKASVFHARADELPYNPAFFVMEYLQGGTLECHLQKVGRLSVAESATIGLEIARGLDFVHREGFAHNDLKLENIVFRESVIIGRKFTPVCVDFGVATRVAPPQGGTLYIMSPEQVENVNLHSAPELNQEINAAKIDVWGLGVILYRMLGGQLPFSSNNERRLTDQIRNYRPESLYELSPDVSRHLDEIIIDGCLAKNASHRLNLLELGKELKRLADGGVPATTEPKPAWSPASFVRRVFGRS
jgi:serine/threonine-protein kinase